METVLEIKDLKKDYGEFRLNGVNLSIKKGTLTGIVGPNGAGKSTTIKCILDMVRADSGQITVLGHDSVKDVLQIKSQLGIVLDDGHFYEHLSLGKMKRLIAPMYPTWDEEAYHRYLQQFELNESKKIKDLSRGMRMKYSLCLALSHGADLLLLDEPTSGLDPIARSEFMEILLRLVREDSKTVVMSTHITSDIEKIADDLIFMYQGKILLQGSLSAIKAEHSRKDPYIQNPSIEDIMLYYIRGYAQ